LNNIIPDKRQASILAVDDTPANLQVLAGMLKERGYRVRPVPSGKLALQAARHDPPDLILLDINMPEMNGYQVCEQLKADETLKRIPVIFISALTDQLDKVKAFSTGGVDYLTKPFQMEELHARVETHLKLRQMQIDLETYTRQLEAAQKRLELDLKLAREVQHGFLPLRTPEIPGYAFSAHYEPAYEVGGDYYDFIPLPGNRTAVLVGDVAGKGVAAALVMAKLSADARFCVLTETDPAAAFTRLNGLMSESGIEGRFVTLMAAILDPAEHSVTLVNAGHPAPLIYHGADGTVVEAITKELPGFPLGVTEGFEYTSRQVYLKPGDLILAFTDGVIEATNPDGGQLESKGLCAALQGAHLSSRTIVEQVLKTLSEFSSGRRQSDDLTLVGFGRNDS
jgi:serine phosphatase RsbU (regulator of sigma subunit)